MKYNAIESLILAALEPHRGRDNAISRQELIRNVNAFAGGDGPFDERRIRHYIKHLVTKHGIAIGSCHEGYFLVESARELEDVCRYYDSYGLSALHVSARLRREHLDRYLGQLSMRLARS